MGARQTLPSVCPLDCPDRCALDVVVEDGRVVEIDGSRRSPLTAGYICAKVRRFGERVDSKERVLHPMRRTGPKGSGAYERISWDEAIATVAGRLASIARESGPEAILPYHYDGSNGLLTAHGMDERFWNRLGASQLGRTFCAANTGAGWSAVLGDLPGSDPQEAEHADAIVLWGVNPSVSGIHLVPPVRRAKKRGAYLVVVDPRRTPLARDADLHLPILPATDVVVALSAISVLAREGLADTKFLARWARGWPELQAAAKPWTPERAGELAGIPSDSIAKLARELARRKSVFFRVGWGLERNRNGTDGVRSVLSLRAALGRFDAPGAGLTISTSAGFRMDFGPGERRDLRTKATRTINMSEMGRALEETSDPPIRALYVYNCNPTATAPNQGRVVRALAREDLFTVVHEQVWTDTCALADVVLPATTFLEHKEMCRQYGGYSLQWGEPVIAPRGEARSNHAVFAELARAMRFDGDAFAASEEDIARATLGATRAASVDLERLRAERFVPMPSVRPFVDVFPSRGHVDLSAPPGPPNYRPAPVDAHLPLSLISPASDKAITSTLFELVPAGSATVAMSPSDAAARGLRAGDRARVWNSIGEVVLRVAVSDEIPAGVASIPKGLWRRATENGWTANALAPDHVDELGGGACYNDARVDVAPA